MTDGKRVFAEKKSPVALELNAPFCIFSYWWTFLFDGPKHPEIGLDPTTQFRSQHAGNGWSVTGRGCFVWARDFPFWENIWSSCGRGTDAGIHPKNTPRKEGK